MDARQIQRFALDAKGDPVDIRDVADKSGPFFCLCCHSAMIAKTGSIRAWHFAHKGQACSCESYIHSLAKARIAKWFNESETIVLELESRWICAESESCPFHDPRNCSHIAIAGHDLKRYYRSCGTEMPKGGFIPDILCDHPEAPLFIEVFVTHECSERKKASGNRIIEFAVNSEDDIDRILSLPVLAESESVRLHGFKRPDIPCRRFRRPLVKYTLLGSGEDFVSADGIDCGNFRSRQPEAIYEVTSDMRQSPALIAMAGKAMAYRDGFIPKDCNICSRAGGDPGARICTVYCKRCGNSAYWKDNDARKCEMFDCDEDIIDDFLAAHKDFHFEVWRHPFRKVQTWGRLQ